MKHAGLVLATLIVVLACNACSEDNPACIKEDRGAVVLTVIPAPESGFLTFTGTLEAVDPLFTEPPVVRYRFRRADNQNIVDINIPEFGYRIAIETGTSYTVAVQKGTLIDRLLFSWGVTFADSEGTAALIVTDWTPGFSVFTDADEDGYELTRDGSAIALRVTFEDPGCDPRIANTNDFRDITNRTLGFSLEGQVLQLFHDEAGTLGDWDVEVFRSQKVVHKSQTAAMNQISFAVSRRAETP